MHQFIKKSTPFELKDYDNQKGIIKGYLNRFGNEDLHGDVMVKGAYADTIVANGPMGDQSIKYLYYHSEPIGKFLELAEDDFGLSFVGKLSIGTTKGRDVFELYKDGVITQHSVSVLPKKYRDETKDGHTVRHIENVVMRDGSAVLWGANPDTPTTAVSKAIDNVLRNGTLSDEGFAVIVELREKIDAVLQTQKTQTQEQQAKHLLKNLISKYK